MATFRIGQLAELTRQMNFTPSDQRARQVTGAEELLLQIDPAKAYPFDFILFRITGFHPKRVAPDSIPDEGFTGQLLTGLALQHDLGLLIELVSDSLEQCVELFSEPVLSLDEVCRRYNVSDKSIQRWRRRGLAGRRVIYPDGKKRLGFLASSLERFFAIHRDSLARAANFSEIGDDESDRILRAAHRLASRGCCGDEIVERISSRLSRSPLNISHLLEQADKALLTSAPQSFPAEEQAELARQFDAGAAPRDLARKLGRPRSTIYRAILAHRLGRLLSFKIKFTDDDLYHQPDAHGVIDAIAGAGEIAPESAAEERRLPRDLPPYFQALYRNPLLTSAQERAFFLKFNFHKFQFVTLRRKLQDQPVRWRSLRKLERFLNLATETKNRIVAANLRLVVSVARKHLPATAVARGGLMDLVSDGNITLMRAVEAFDVHRGNRFSTYAMFSLMKDFARRGSGPSLPDRDIDYAHEIADPHQAFPAEQLSRREEVHNLLSRLGEREQAVLRAHFGLTERGSESSYEEVGRELGMSTQRVRQIEQAALAKLRESAAE